MTLEEILEKYDISHIKVLDGMEKAIVGIDDTRYPYRLFYSQSKYVEVMKAHFLSGGADEEEAEDLASGWFDDNLSAYYGEDTGVHIFFNGDEALFDCRLDDYDYMYHFSFEEGFYVMDMNDEEIVYSIPEMKYQLPLFGISEEDKAMELCILGCKIFKNA